MKANLNKKEYLTRRSEYVNTPIVVEKYGEDVVLIVTSEEGNSFYAKSPDGLTKRLSKAVWTLYDEVEEFNKLIDEYYKESI